MNIQVSRMQIKTVGGRKIDLKKKVEKKERCVYPSSSFWQTRNVYSEEQNCTNDDKKLSPTS